MPVVYNELLECLRSIDCYPFEHAIDAPLIANLAVEFSNVDLHEEIQRFKLWLLEISPGPRIHYRLLLRKWIYNASKKTRSFYNQE
jgi:hypothetical protein